MKVIRRWPRKKRPYADRAAPSLAEKSRTPVYLVHIGTKEGIEKLRQIKPFNKYVHIETTSPYLAVTSEQFDGPLYKMEPPLRNQEDKNALWEALDDGVIDTIGIDNICESKEEKQPERSIWGRGFQITHSETASGVGIDGAEGGNRESPTSKK